MSQVAMPDEPNDGLDESKDPSAIDPVVRQKMQSAEQQFKKLLDLVLRVMSIQNGEELSAGIQVEVEAYNARRMDLVKRFKEMVKPVLSVLSRLGNPSQQNPELGDLMAAVDAVKTTRLIELQEAVEVASSGAELAKRCAAELAQVAEKAEADYASVLEEVKAWLTEGGQGAESTEAGIKGTNGPVAERQFDHLAKRNKKSRAAWMVMHGAKNRRANVNEAAVRCEQASENIKAELTQLTASELRI